MKADDKILKTIRLAHFELAKGHLNALVQTYWGDVNDPEFNAVDEKIIKFIDELNNLL